MNSDVVMHYPSVPTAYYATGQWALDFVRDEEKKDRRKLGDFKVIKEEPSGQLLNKLFFKGKQLIDDPRTFYCYVPVSFNGNFGNRYWKRAPIPDNEQVIERFPRITNNSGKFLIFVDSGKIEALCAKIHERISRRKAGIWVTVRNICPESKCIGQRPCHHRVYRRFL